MLEKSEFDLLVSLVGNPYGHFSQRTLGERLGISLGKVNKLIKNLTEKGLITGNDAEYRITDKGRTALEPYKVDNAVIMAAGMSSRFAPLSYEKPKGLLVVKGQVLIEREIEQLKAAGIRDITLVVGYMGEKFFYLEDKYGIKIVMNEDYFRYNNPSTLIRVADQLKNTYICSSDDYFTENVFEPYVYQAYYSAVYFPGQTEEYALTCAPNGRIKKVTIGGENAWCMLGHVYFDRTFSQKFREILLREYDRPETREHLWEVLYMNHIDELDLYIRRYEADKILEFDSLDELRQFDSEYINNVDSEIFRNICGVLKCEARDIVDIHPIRSGLTNTSFLFEVRGERYVYRHPGRGTSRYINRTSEAFSMEKAAELRLDRTFIAMDPDKGWKISKYIENVRELDYHNAVEVDQALSIVRKLHAARIRSEYDFGIWNKTEEFISRIRDTGLRDFPDFDELYRKVSRVYSMVSEDRYADRCLCHNDCYSPNFLLNERDEMSLIDWEYSGNDDPASDLGTFICCSDYSYEEALQVIEKYLEKKPEEGQLAHFLGYVSVAAYYWFVWALYQESRGNSVGEWLYLWYKNSKLYADRALRAAGK